MTSITTAAKTIYRSKAPLRIGLAGGGTDVSPYADLYGGAILNASISLYAHASIEPLAGDSIELIAADMVCAEILPLSTKLSLDGPLLLAKGVYNALCSDYNLKAKAFRLTTSVDAPAGSGLGTSSTLVVAILGAFLEWLDMPMGEYDIAHYAYKIERSYLKMAGGRQDQYAATFGGVNFMEFSGADKVIVNPLRIKSSILQELEQSLVLFYTQKSRQSSTIIESQSRNVSDQNQEALSAMHALKSQAFQMKDALLKGKLSQLGLLLDHGFQHKKKMAAAISNSDLDTIYAAALQAGAAGGKISGAGGGGFMTFYCPGTTRYAVEQCLAAFSGTTYSFQFVAKGLVTWRMDLD